MNAHETAQRRLRVAEMAKRGMSQRKIAAALGVSKTTIDRDMRHIALPSEVLAASAKRKPSRARYPLPVGFASFAVGKTYEQLQRHYGVSSSTIDRWRKLVGIQPTRYAFKWPANLAEMAADMTLSELAQAVGRSRDRLGPRLKADHPDIYAICIANSEKRRRELAAANLAKANAANQTAGKKTGFVMKPLRARENEAVLSLADKAMRWLQRIAPCYPRRIYGQEYGGYVFALRAEVLNADEIVAEARKRGWNPDAWREISHAA